MLGAGVSSAESETESDLMASPSAHEALGLIPPRCRRCGKEIENRTNSKFCGLACYWASLVGRPPITPRKRPYERTCIMCGRTFTKFGKTAKYCSRSCYAKSMVGIKRAKVDILTCKNCHVQYPHRRSKSDGKTFCSHRCYSIFKTGKPQGPRDDSFRRTPEWRQRYREIRLRIIYPRNNTKPELILSHLLDNLGVTYNTQYIVSNVARPDFAFVEKKVAIFVDGDYWHANPKKYSNGPINEMQAKNVRRDIWQETQLENDLRQRPLECASRLSSLYWKDKRNEE